MKIQFSSVGTGRRSKSSVLFLGSPAIILLAFFALGSGKANADTITTFHATGTFQGGASLTGTLTIDTTTGTVTASTLEVPPDATGLDQIALQLPVGNFYGVSITTDENFPDLDVFFPTTLVGYTGGPLGSLTDPLTAPSINVETDLFTALHGQVLSLESGALTPVSAVPEKRDLHYVCHRASLDRAGSAQARGICKIHTAALALRNAEILFESIFMKHSISAFSATFALLALAAFSPISAKAQGCCGSPQGHHGYSLASLHGSYSMIGTYAANVGRGLGLIAFDGRGDATGSSLVNQPGPNGTRTIVNVTFSGTYSVNSNGTGTISLAVYLPNG